MAKKTPTRSQANDGLAAGTPAQPKARRVPKGRPAPAPESLTAFPDVERTENDDAALNAASGDNQPASAMPASSQPEASSSMGSEPSDEDIRMRAYQRFLERGGGHGTDFEDWLAAERDLKVGSKP